ncbi:MAG: DNA-directed RNA polymerase subunit omega [Paludibacteraceae bacterium]|nr:DNA-directed RNA polymerase subunit omega [Candidatus Physcocola equi]MCQ2234966.1 DNA-directed RNA polymerase subunit omega [Paludibacteraceae bacterium]
MDYKKLNAPTTTITRDLNSMCGETNVYEVINVIAKRSNQIAVDIKNELDKKLQEFASVTDSLEEIHENREQIEISCFYERLPKPTLMATQEFIDGGLSYHINGKKNVKFDK